MTFYVEYPQQRYVVSTVTIQREVLLPNDVRGILNVREGQQVEINTIIARGQRPARHHIVEAAKKLRLRKPEQLNELLTVAVGDPVTTGDPLTTRRRRVVSPVDGTVAGIEGGRIIVREEAEEVEVIAGIQGWVIQLIPRRGVVIQASASVVQGVWGNNRRAVGAIRVEPEEGLELIQGDSINLEWRGAIVLTKRPLSEIGMRIMEEQDIAGVIAPSMDSTLLGSAVQFERAIMLTEGFGEARMSVVVQNFIADTIENNRNIRGTLDAVTPNPLEIRRPELMMNVITREGQEPPAPRTVDRLRKGMQVKVTRFPYTGQMGTIVEIPQTPVQIDGGIRTAVARVQLTSGDTVNVPIANLEVFAG